MWLFSLPYLINPELWLNKLICLGIGLIVVGLGTALYLHANFAPIPVDLLMLTIRDLTGMNILLSRTIVNLLFLTMSILFIGLIGIGTLLTVLLRCPILNFYLICIDDS